MSKLVLGLAIAASYAWIGVYLLNHDIPYVSSFIASLGADLQLPVRAAFKTLPVVLMALSVASRSTTFALGLILSGVGDFALAYEKVYKMAFIVGLASFLLAHICYIVAFKSKGQSLVAALITLGGASFLLKELLPHVMSKSPDLTIPVCVYCTAIALMAYRSFASGSWLAFIGALVFVVSDFTLAWDKFAPAPAFTWWHPRLIVMSTYYVAQVLITMSADSFGKKEAAKRKTN